MMTQVRMMFFNNVNARGSLAVPMNVAHGVKPAAGTIPQSRQYAEPA